MDEQLSGTELLALVQRVFLPQPGEGDVAILVDLPDAQVPDDAAWAARRAMAADWVGKLSALATELGRATRLVVYPNVHTNNGDLPARAWLHGGGPLPSTAELDPANAIAFADLYARDAPVIASFAKPRELHTDQRKSTEAIIKLDNPL